jgi:hypothetical protein
VGPVPINQSLLSILQYTIMSCHVIFVSQKQA